MSLYWKRKRKLSTTPNPSFTDEQPQGERRRVKASKVVVISKTGLGNGNGNGNGESITREKVLTEEGEETMIEPTKNDFSFHLPENHNSDSFSLFQTLKDGKSVYGDLLLRTLGQGSTETLEQLEKEISEEKPQLLQTKLNLTQKEGEEEEEEEEEEEPLQKKRKQAPQPSFFSSFFSFDHSNPNVPSSLVTTVSTREMEKATLAFDVFAEEEGEEKTLSTEEIENALQALSGFYFSFSRPLPLPRNPITFNQFLLLYGNLKEEALRRQLRRGTSSSPTAPASDEKDPQFITAKVFHQFLLAHSPSMSDEKVRSLVCEVGQGESLDFDRCHGLLVVLSSQNKLLYDSEKGFVIVQESPLLSSLSSSRSNSTTSLSESITSLLKMRTSSLPPSGSVTSVISTLASPYTSVRSWLSSFFTHPPV